VREGGNLKLPARRKIPSLLQSIFFSQSFSLSFLYLLSQDTFLGEKSFHEDGNDDLPQWKRVSEGKQKAESTGLSLP
jgi:hypothetical protein